MAPNLSGRPTEAKISAIRKIYRDDLIVHVFEGDARGIYSKSARFHGYFLTNERRSGIETGANANRPYTTSEYLHIA